MNTVSRLSKAAIATAAAAAFAGSGVTTTAFAESDKMGKCMGMNSCKGMSSCKGANNSCKGHNACKGKGFVKMSKEQCMQVAGSDFVFDFFSAP